MYFNKFFLDFLIFGKLVLIFFFKSNVLRLTKTYWKLSNIMCMCNNIYIWGIDMLGRQMPTHITQTFHAAKDIIRFIM